MKWNLPPLTVGMEEELFIVNQHDGELIPSLPAEFLDNFRTRWGNQVTTEFLGCQVELISKPHLTIASLREEMGQLRQDLIDHARTHQLAPMASSTHPVSSWFIQQPHSNARYQRLQDNLKLVAQRLCINGMHIHVGIENEALRLKIQNRLVPYLPLFLALSTSSPYWESTDTGLDSYRVTIFDALPRTGLPPRFEKPEAYHRYIKLLVDSDIIIDAGEIWWEIRLNHRFPTIEMRIADVCTKIDDAMSIAAFYQCLTRWLMRTPASKTGLIADVPALILENRWRAQRYPIKELTLLTQQDLIPAEELLANLLNRFEEDAIALDCVNELQGIEKIMLQGTSADYQRAAFEQCFSQSNNKPLAMEMVIQHLLKSTAQLN